MIKLFKGRKTEKASPTPETPEARPAPPKIDRTEIEQTARDIGAAHRLSMPNQDTLRDIYDRVSHAG